MKQFNLKEYLENPSRKVVTKDSRDTRIICTDRKNPNYPIVALIETKDGEAISYHTKDGKCFVSGESSYDLFFAPEKKIGYINVYADICKFRVAGDIFVSKEAAEEKGKLYSTYITTIKIEWEE